MSKADEITHKQILLPLESTIAKIVKNQYKKPSSSSEEEV